MKGMTLSKYFLFFGCLLSFSCFAASSCPKAEATTSANFCSSFKSSAICYCQASGLPAFACQSVKDIYNRMILAYGSVQAACEQQHDTSTQSCVDDWKCYLEGGRDSQNNLCSSTGKACE